MQQGLETRFLVRLRCFQVEFEKGVFGKKGLDLVTVYLRRLPENFLLSFFKFDIVFVVRGSRHRSRI